jgi:hypothetical protein
MMNQFGTAVGSVGWEADATGLQIAFHNRTRHLQWTEVTAAALVHFSSPDASAGIPTNMLPGLGNLFALNRWLAREQGQLVLARGRSTFRAMRIPIPLEEPGAMALVRETQRYLDQRWIGELPFADHQVAMGMSTPWWFYLLFGLGFVTFGLTILLAIGAFQGLTSGDLAGVPAVAWIALLFWVILVGSVLFIYRRRG